MPNAPVLCVLSILEKIDDRDVMTCVHYLTEINREEATSMAESMSSDPRAAKQRWPNG